MGWRKGTHLWIPASFLIFAGLLLALCLQRKGPWLLLLWPAGNFIALGSAYFGPGGRLFGKRADGSLSPAAAALMLPFLLVCWATWHLQVRLSPEDCCNEIAPGLFLGRRPLPGQYPPAALVVDLTAEFPKPRWYPAASAYLCLPTLDAFAPPPADFAAHLKTAAAAPTVFIHCANGHGRSAAFAAALLLRKGLAQDLDDAMGIIRKVRPQCRLNGVQAAAVERAVLSPEA